MTLLVAAFFVLLAGGVLAMVASRTPVLCSALGATSAAVGCALGEWHAFGALRGGLVSSLGLAWQVTYGRLRIETDALSAFFLIPVFAIGALAAVYGAGYLASYHGRRSLGSVWLAFNVFLAAMALVVVARQAVLFLVAWEIMSLASYLLVAFEHESAEVARASLVYLVASHVCAVVLLAFFVLFGRQAGGFDFETMGGAHPTASVTALLALLALCGFGIKAGFVPLHVWLPEAHAAAPSHVSALMSGVMINMGLYGMLRSLLLLHRPMTWIGPPLVAIGWITALVGIALASYQRDMKRALAYSSVENMGIMGVGIGAALWASAEHRRELAALALTGALLHVWNHALMKPLMFFGAGSILHGCGTRDLERLGGVFKRMPRTGTLLLFGSVALAGLPPLNGFVGEWLVYLGLVQQALVARPAVAILLLLVVGGLSIVGALALFALVRLIGCALLGRPRGGWIAHAHESSPTMIAPMAILAALCAGVALAPVRVTAALSGVVSQVLGDDATVSSTSAPLCALGEMNAILLVSIVVVGFLLAVALRSRRATALETWGCGYAQPTPRMQYTARAFSELLADRILPKTLRARVSMSQFRPSAIFPGRTELEVDFTDPVTRGVYGPFLTRWADRFARLRWMQQGLLHVYVLYILVALVALLGWVSLGAWGSS